MKGEMTNNDLDNLRIEARLSVEQVAKLFGVHFRTAQRWFNGETKRLPVYIPLVLRLIVRYKLNVKDVQELSNTQKD